MFDSKQKELFRTENIRPEARKAASAAVGGSQNGFINAGMKQSAITKSGNGAMKYSTTGDTFVDQFGSNNHFKDPRPYAEIAIDQSKLWAIDPRMSVIFILFIRMVTRVTSMFDGIKTRLVQRGLGYRHEGQMRMIWLHMNHPDTFWKNVQLFISVGSWRDIFAMLQTDLIYNTWDKRQLDWDKFGKLILAGLQSEAHSELVKKYLPQIKTREKCKTVEAQADNLIGKWIADLIRPAGMNKSNGYKHYRQTKSGGTAHTWQQIISRGEFFKLDFDTVHGRALALLIGGKFIQNQKLEGRYTEWILSKPIARYTGYVTELFSAYLDDYGRLLTLPMFKEITLNKQFEGLVETSQKNTVSDTSLIVVRDTSGSMSCSVGNGNVSAGSVAKALALFFSYMLPDGKFKDSWIEFNSSAKMHQWQGSTPAERWRNDTTSFIGNTNFQSVISLFCLFKQEGVPENEFPTGILCLSDGEFDAAELNETNVTTALKSLQDAGFSSEYVKRFQIILWNIKSRAYGGNAGNKFETYGKVGNVFYFSGYDPSILAFLTGVQKVDEVTGEIVAGNVPKNAMELFNEAMDQEVFQLVEI